MMAWPTHNSSNNNNSNSSIQFAESAYYWSNADVENLRPEFPKRSQAFFMSSSPQSPTITVVSSMLPSYNCTMQLPSTPVSFGTIPSPISTYSDLSIRTTSTKENRPELPSAQRNEGTVSPASSSVTGHFASREDLAGIPPTKCEASQLDGSIDLCTAKSNMSCCSRQKSKKKDTGYGAFKCEWKGCQYDRMFSRKGVLMRHIEMQHVNPRSFKCPWCSHATSRRENMKAHRQAIHKEWL